MGKKNELLLDDGELLILQTQLAVIVGDRQAIALQQIHYWLGINEKAEKETHFFDGCWWAYNTWVEWRKKNFPFWSINTIRRVFQDLEAAALITTRPHKNKSHGLWVTINYSQLDMSLKEHGLTLRVRRVSRREQVERFQNGIKRFQNGIKRFQNGQDTSDTETKTEVEDTAAAIEEKESTPLPFHIVHGLGNVKHNAVVAAVEAHPVWQAYVRGWDATPPVLSPGLADIERDTLKVVEIRMEQLGATLEDIEAFTREKVNNPKRKGDVRLSYVAADLHQYMARKRTQVVKAPQPVTPQPIRPADVDPETARRLAREARQAVLS